MSFDNLIVVVRSARERTIESCKNLLLEIFAKSDVIVISEVPFSKAVEKSFEIGISSGKEWLACIDADVLISKEQTLRFLNYAMNTNSNFYCIQSLIFDNFFSIIRPSGIHLYRIKHCILAKKFIRKEDLFLRPESFLKKEMALIGYPTQQASIVIGIHDYEQYYADIYRKCFLQAHKHRPYVEAILPYWRNQAKENFDFQMAIYGSASGKVFSGKIEVSKTFLKEEIVELMSVKGIKEKDTLLVFNEGLIDEIIAKGMDNPIPLQEIMFPKGRWQEIINKENIMGSQNKHEASQSLIKKTGNALVKLGKWIHKQG